MRCCGLWPQDKPRSLCYDSAALRHRVAAQAREGVGPETRTNQATSCCTLPRENPCRTSQWSDCGLKIYGRSYHRPAAPTTEHEQKAIVRIALERLLNQHHQAVESLAHVGVSARKPYLHSGRNRKHRASVGMKPTGTLFAAPPIAV